MLCRGVSESESGRVEWGAIARTNTVRVTSRLETVNEEQIGFRGEGRVAGGRALGRGVEVETRETRGSRFPRPGGCRERCKRGRIRGEKVRRNSAVARKTERVIKESVNFRVIFYGNPCPPASLQPLRSHSPPAARENGKERIMHGRK